MNMNMNLKMDMCMNMDMDMGMDVDMGIFERTMFDIDRGLFRFRVNSISIITVVVDLLSDSIKEYDATRTRHLYIARLAAHWPRTGLPCRLRIRHLLSGRQH